MTTPSPQSIKTTTALYEAIKAQEVNFPIPTPSAVIVVGTLNVTTGKFAGLVTTTEVIQQPNVKPPQKIVTLTPVGDCHGVRAVLQFSTTGIGITVTVGATTVGSKLNHVEIDVGFATSVKWTVSSGGHTYSDTVNINRELMVGVGAFTLPALPTAIVYEPPPDAAKKNKAAYGTTQSVATSVKMSFGSDQSTTTTDDGSFSTLVGLGNGLKSLADVVKSATSVNGAGSGSGSSGGISAGLGAGVAAGAAGASGGTAAAVVAVVAGALDFISAAIGSVTTTSGTDVGQVNSNSVTITTSRGASITTGQSGGNAGGPGIGDLYHVLLNVRMLWLANGGAITLTILDYGSEAIVPVSQLKLGHPQGGLDAATMAALVPLDPFAAGNPATVPLPATRFSLKTTMEMWTGAGEWDQPISTTISGDVSSAQTSTTTTVVDARAGFLAFAGIGVTQSSTTKSSITNTAATDVGTAQTQTATVSLYAGPNDPIYAVAVYEDLLFGTLAFQSVPVSPTPVLTGTVTGTDGKGHPGVVVTATSNGHTFSTLSGPGGQFAFHAETMKPGAVVLTTGKTTVNLAGLTKGVNLHTTA